MNLIALSKQDASLRKFILAVAIIGFVFLPALAVKTNTWMSSSQAGKWADPSNWAENRALEEGDFVMIPENMTATMNDADFLAVPAIAGIIYAKTTSTMCFDVENEGNVVSWFVNGAGDNRSGTLGKMVKNGPGTVELAKVGAFWYYSDLVVNDGELCLQRCETFENIFFNKVTVNAPGVLVAPYGCDRARFWCYAGLDGNGVVTNSESRYKIIYFGGAGSFAGTLTGDFSIRIDNNARSLQNFLSTGNTGSADHYFEGESIFGLASIGGIGADGVTKLYGSIGTGAMHLDMNSGVRYLGTGEVSPGAFLSSALTRSMTIDGGPHGGLSLVNKIDFSSATGSVARLYLKGTNLVECTLDDCRILDPSMHSSGKGTLSVVKQGSGTWVIASPTNALFSGLVVVEDGTLQFDSLDEAGQKCSLGLADLLVKDMSYSGEDLTDDMLVPYAWIVGQTAGDSATTGTLEYVGTEAICCRTRPLAVRGAGRIASSGGSLDLSGASAAVPGTNTLILAGESGANVYRELSDGDAGVLAVVKEGAGTWRLGGTLTFSGGIDVKGGTLEIMRTASPAEYVFYRFNMKERFRKDEQPSWATHIDCGKLALFDADLQMQNVGLVYNEERNGRPWKLQPGEFAFQNTTADFDYSNYDFGGNSPEGLFSDYKTHYSQFIRVNDSRYTSSNSTKFAWPWLENPDSWVRVVFRLPENHETPESYELGSRWGNSGDGSLSEVHSWSLEGSCDGLNWTELSSVVSNSPSGGSQSWWSCTQSYLNENPKPRAIAASLDSVAHTVLPDGTRIGVSPGATIRVDSEIPVAVNALAVSTDGFGTVEGFAFADNGTIYLTGEGSLDGMIIPGTITGCSGGMSGWSVVYNGKPKPRMRIRMTPEGLAVIAPGMDIIVR